ncbi:MAG: putative baseplate assembly protein [Actinomycetales bacterium]|nr:putative baseplate assembly protein [Actinomycetales bacterium]
MTTDETDTCGCCAEEATVPVVHNLPGLDALAYRVGTHPDFLRRMLARLPIEAVEDGTHPPHRPLARLTTRSTDDPAIALLDAWAAVGDVLTFYQERIANEGFLRTATERRSILELARLIGYELNPGVAAGAFLAFGTDTAGGAPDAVVLRGGSRVQSVPGPGELPQTFETHADMTARVEWNRLQPRRMRPQQLAISSGGLHLLGGGAVSLPVTGTFPLDADVSLPASGTVPATEVDTIYAVGTSTNLGAGDVILLAGRQVGGSTTSTLVKTVRRITEQPELDRTRIVLDDAVPATTFHAFGLPTFASASIMQTALDATNVDEIVVGQAWSEGALSAWLSVQGWNAASAVSYIYGAYSKPSPPPAAPGDPGAFAMRARLGLFGHNAPAYASLTPTAQTPFFAWDNPAPSIWKDSLKPPANATTAPYYGDADCFLERSVPGITANSWAVLERPTKQFTAFRVKSAPESSLVGYSLSAKTTGLNLGSASDGSPLANSTTDKSESFGVRRTTAHVLSDRLTLAQLPIDDPLGKDTPEETQLTLDRMVLNLAQGQPVAVTGERDDLPGVEVSEVVVLDRVQHAGGFTTLFFISPGLTFRYARGTVRLCANVVDATHGESVTEVLGSGDGGRPNQRFTLRKPPLTYTASSGATGAQSSLEVRVDGVAWSGTPRLYGRLPTDEQYLVRRADDGTVSVLFGDGVQGARLPSGVQSVVASYRNGIGRAGMVRPGSLTLLMTRPLGIRDVTNPLAAAGAADPEQRDDARRNAPLTVLAMERVVSLQDAEDFSRAFAGVGKCTATALTHHGAAWIHLTVAAAAPKPGAGGLATGTADHRVQATSALRTNLDDALRAAKEPSVQLRLDTYQPLFFNVVARLLVERRYRWADVEAAARTALAAAFSFERRSFGQPVSVTEVVTTIQRTPGVVFVDLDALHRFDLAASLPPGNVLVAGGVVWGEDETEPSGLAQLLVVNPLGITLTPVPEGSIA